MKFRELEKIVLDNGWIYKCVKGSHNQYAHLAKGGKVTIPCGLDDVAPIIIKSVLKYV